MRRSRIIVLLVALLVIGIDHQIQAACKEGTALSSDFYSGRDDLKTIGLGRSAYTENGRDGVVVNIFQKKNDGTYVVEVIEITMDRNHRQKNISRGYFKAWKDNKNQICFEWQGRKYHTSPQILP